MSPCLMLSSRKHKWQVFCNTCLSDLWKHKKKYLLGSCKKKSKHGKVCHVDKKEGWYGLGGRKRIPVLVWQLKNEIMKGSIRTIFRLSTSGNSCCLWFILSIEKSTRVAWCEWRPVASPGTTGSIWYFSSYKELKKTYLLLWQSVALWLVG